MIEQDLRVLTTRLTEEVDCLPSVPYIAGLEKAKLGRDLAEMNQVLGKIENRPTKRGEGQ